MICLGITRFGMLAMAGLLLLGTATTALAESEAEILRDCRSSTLSRDQLNSCLERVRILNQTQPSPQLQALEAGLDQQLRSPPTDMGPDMGYDDQPPPYGPNSGSGGVIGGYPVPPGAEVPDRRFAPPATNPEAYSGGGGWENDGPLDGPYTADPNMPDAAPRGLSPYNQYSPPTGNAPGSSPAWDDEWPDWGTGGPNEWGPGGWDWGDPDDDGLPPGDDDRSYPENGADPDGW